MGKTCHQLISPSGESRYAAIPPDQVGGFSESLLFETGGETIPILRSVVPVSIGGNGYFVESFVNLLENKKT